MASVTKIFLPMSLWALILVEDVIPGRILVVILWLFFKHNKAHAIDNAKTEQIVIWKMT